MSQDRVSGEQSTYAAMIVGYAGVGGLVASLSHGILYAVVLSAGVSTLAFWLTPSGSALHRTLQRWLVIGVVAGLCVLLLRKWFPATESLSYAGMVVVVLWCGVSLGRVGMKQASGASDAGGS